MGLLEGVAGDRWRGKGEGVGEGRPYHLLIQPS